MISGMNVSLQKPDKVGKKDFSNKIFKKLINTLNKVKIILDSEVESSWVLYLRSHLKSTMDFIITKKNESLKNGKVGLIEMNNLI